MKTRVITILAILLGSLSTHAQDIFREQFAIPLSKPGERGYLEIGQVNGDVIVEGYKGNEVIVEAVVHPERSKPKDKDKYDELKQKEKDKWTLERDKLYQEKERDIPEGMKRIASNPVEITAEEDDNQVTIETQSWKRWTDLTIKVPEQFDLHLHTVHGVIKVTGVSGEMEVSNVNGSVILNQIQGAVLANTVNGHVEARLKKVDANAEMSFVTLHGDVDVTLPKNAKVTAKMKSDRGEIYSDFDMKTSSAREEVTKGDGQYKVSINSFVIGTINGGGPVYTFKNMTGNIIIREGN